MALEPLIYDETTGLPKLPEGYAWSVAENEYAYYEDDPSEAVLFVRIAKSLPQKLTWWDQLIGREPETEWLFRLHDYSGTSGKASNSAESVKEAATKIYNKLRDDELEKAQLRTLVGLYPPKSIL